MRRGVCRCCWRRGTVWSATTPFFAFIPVLQEVVRREYQRRQREDGSTEADDATPSPAHFQSAVLSMLPAADRPYASILLDALLGVADTDGGGRAGAAEGVVVESWLRPKVLRRLMRALLRHHFSAQPSSLLCVEDGHWLDLQSWMLLKEVAEAEPKVRLLLTTRPLLAVGEPTSPTPSSQSIPALYAAVCKAESASHHVLSGLDEEASASLAARFLRCASLSEGLARTIHERSDGIPLFIQHLVAYMQQAGLVTIDPGTQVASLLDKPDELESSLPSSLRRCWPLCWTVCSRSARWRSRWPRSSAVTSPAPCCRCRTPCTSTGSGCGSCWRPRSCRAWWTRREEDAVDDAFYRFTHHLLHDAAYDALLYHQRRDLHARIADHLAAIHARSRKSPTASTRSSVHLLAYHYYLALCNADDALIDQPEPRLLDAAIEHLLQSAVANLQLGCWMPPPCSSAEPRAASTG